VRVHSSAIWQRIGAIALLATMLGAATEPAGASGQADADVPVGPVRPVDERPEEGILHIVHLRCTAIEGNFSAVLGPLETGAPPTDDATCQRGSASFLVTDAAAEAAVAEAGADGEVRLTGLAIGKGMAIETATGNAVAFDIGLDTQTVVTFWTQVNAEGQVAKPISAGAGGAASADSAASQDLSEVATGQGGDLVDVVSPALAAIGQPTAAPPVAIDAAQVTTLPITGEGNAGGNGDTLVLVLGLAALLVLGILARTGKKAMTSG